MAKDAACKMTLAKVSQAAPAVFRSKHIFTPCCRIRRLPRNLLLATEKH